MGSVSYAKTLHECIENDKPHKWTEQEIQDHLEGYRGEFYSASNPNNNIKLETSRTLPIQFVPPYYTETRPHEQQQYGTQTDTPHEQSLNRTNQQSNDSKRWIEEQGLAYATDRAQGTFETHGFSNMLINIMRVYNSDEKKYGGE